MFGSSSDRIAGAGALGGLYTALVEAPTEQVLVIACDMPFLTAPFLRTSAERGRGVDVARAARRARTSSAVRVVRPPDVAGHLHARIESGDLRVGDALADLAVRELGPDELAPFDPDGRLLLNVNTPDDYARARD